jgi:peroxiredoxin Q/BCP
MAGSDPSSESWRPLLPIVERMPLKPGDMAPDCTLLDQLGEPFSLEKSLSERKARHLIYFYPKADTPGCTVQACGLRDIAGEIGDTVIVGISPDTPARLKKFDEKYDLGFTLLSDVDHDVAERYGVWGEKKNYGKTYMGVVRSAFLIDEHGAVEQAWPKISPKDTPTNLLSALEN